MPNKVLVTGSSVAHSFLQDLESAGLVVHNPQNLLSEDDLKGELADAVAYLLGGDEIATEVALGSAESLRIIAFLGVGYESFIDVEAADKQGVVVTNTPGTLTDSVAEFTVGHVINANRRLTQYINAYRAGTRDREEKQHDLAAKSIGIVGLGAIGTRIAETLRNGFGATVTYYSRTRKPHEEERLGISYRELSELAETSDVLIVMTPGNEQTAGLISVDIVRALRPGSILVNTARPSVVDQVALREGLESGRISVAAFDGFYHDDSGEALLSEFGEDRLLVTGHIASLTHEARDRMSRMAVASIIRVLQTGTDDNIVGQAGKR